MLSAADLAIYRAAHIDAMHDTCYVLAHSTTRGATGEAVDVWTAGSAVVCGLEETNGTKRYRTEATELPIDATIRLALTVTVGAQDRIQLLTHYGETLSAPITYNVIGEPKRGPSAQVVDCRRVAL
jgi:head-tail adaptor